MNGPSPRRMNTGSSRPTARMARTGELTPPGIRRCARSYNSERINATMPAPVGARPVPPAAPSSQPPCQVLRPVREHQVGAGTLDRDEGLERRGTLVQVPRSCGGLDHGVLARDVVGG